MMIRFEWNQIKESGNREKHGVSFNEAITVFYDENARLYFDPEHSGEEERFLLLGLSTNMRLLLVSFTEFNNGALIRIISARKATVRESKNYLD